jgi:hypothetical protein
MYPKNPPPGEFFYLDAFGKRARFGEFTGPKPMRPDPKVIQEDKKKVADYIREKQAEKDRKLEEENKKAEELQRMDEEEQKKYMERLEKAKAERRAASEAKHREDLAKLQRGGVKLGVQVVEVPKAP